MIREYNADDLKKIDEYLSFFDVNFEKINNQFLKIYVYEEDEIYGVLVFDLIYNRIEIEYIIVNLQKRKIGIATKLIEEIEKLDVVNITLEVNENNKSAINFYKKMGFKEISIRKNYYGKENGILFMKKLGE